MVFLFHYGAGGASSPSHLTRLAGSVLGLGWAGVDLFFVLSGFLITGILLDSRLREDYYRTFYWRRALRIFPIFYLLAAILAIAWPHWKPLHATFLLYVGFPAALLWPWLIAVPVRITHLWSLAVEEQFYCVWPAIVRRVAWQTLLRVCGVMIVAALILRCIFALVAISWMYPFILSRCDSLAVGAALAITLRRLPNVYAAIKRMAPLVLAACILGLIMVCVARGTTNYTDPLVGTVGYSLLAIGGGAAVALAASTAWAIHLFSFLPLRILGRYSYGLYLYHFPLTSITEKFKTHLPGGPLVYVAVCFALNLAIAAISFHLIEAPIMAWGRNKTLRPTHKHPVNGVIRVGPAV